MISEVWSELGGDPQLADEVAVLAPEAEILPGPLPVGEFAVGCVASALLAASELTEARGRERPGVSLDAEHVAASFTSERHVRVEARELGSGFAPLSTWLRVADGWVRSHANYPRHREALLRVLRAGAEPESVRAAAAGWNAEKLEDEIFAAGGCAAALRERSAWEAHPQGSALAALGGVLDMEERTDASPLESLGPDDAPAAGVRVLDLTRVIAGPVAGRTLAALGASVLRIDPPGLPELELSALDGGPGKRSALLDLRTGDGQRTFHALLERADVLIEGYRPGALDSLGFGTAELSARYPNLVTASLSAWGHAGAWGGRRGFDSLVQSASGIAVECTSGEAATPGALPAQALDHGTGHMIAAAVLRGLAARTREGRTIHARFALARTAAWLLGRPRDGGPTAGAPPDASRFLTRLGAVTLVAPPGELGGRPLRWSSGPEPVGASLPSW